MKNHKVIKLLVIGLSVVLMTAGCLCTLFNYLNNKELVKIDNFDQYYRSVPDETKRVVFASIYSTAKENTENNIPMSGAVLRDSEPFLLYYDSKDERFKAEFVVDIPKLQQSYLVKFNYNLNSEAPLGGYAALVYCLDKEKMIYPDFGCKELLPFETGDEESGEY